MDQTTIIALIMAGSAMTLQIADRVYKWFQSKNTSTDNKKDVIAIVEKAAREGALNLGFAYNPHPPGQGTICRENRERIVRLETKVDELRDDLKDMKRKINGVR